jgi:flagellar hook assembly protein FlgD
MLLNNYPNPFNPSTTINFSVKEKQQVLIEVFNIKGQKVATLTNKEYDNGSHSVIWNGLDDAERPTSSGVYFYRMKTENYESIKKMILMK